MDCTALLSTSPTNVGSGSKAVKFNPSRCFPLGHQLLTFAFISPVDGATHTSSLGMSAFPDGRALRMGDVFQVLASRTKPDKTRQV